MTNRTRTSISVAKHPVRTGARKAHMARAAGAVGLTILMFGCSRGDNPLSPSPGTPPLATTYTVSGNVSEMTPAGEMAVEGMRMVELNTGRHATTAADGSYNLSGLPARSISVAATKSGYITDTKTFVITGNTQLDFRVGRIVLEAYTLSGVVFEMTPDGRERVPVAAVELYCDACEQPDGHTYSHSDADGVYRFSSVLNGTYPLLVRKAGYELADPSGMLGNGTQVKNATVKGDTRFDIELVRRP